MLKSSIAGDVDGKTGTYRVREQSGWRLESDDKNQVCLRETVHRRNIMVRLQDEKITQ